jgi:uncharacterized protein (TIGR02453 family)
MGAFRGWSPAVIDFYLGLEADNSRTYWLENKPTFDDQVRAPFDDLSEMIEDEFGPLKVFRPNRDVRFSKDKSPYKTACYGVAEGEGGAGYYVGISAQGLAVGSGYWMMAKDQLVRFRAAVDDAKTGPKLEVAVADVRKKKLEIEGHSLKTAPRGYPRDHERIELLRCKSLAAMRSYEPAKWLGTTACATRILDVWRSAAPVNDWLDTNVGPSEEPPDDRWSR